MTAASSEAKPHIAVVVPVFNEHEVLPRLLARLTAVFDSTPEFSWNAVFVDDGSSDDSGAILARAETTDPRIGLVQLTRNFGHQAALCAGLAATAAADAVITLDADLQDPPELIPKLAAAWQQGAEVVVAVRRSRVETGWRRLGFDLFHGLFSRFSDFSIPRNTGTFGLMARPALDAFLSLPERHRFFPGLRAWVGFRQAVIEYDRQARQAGQPVQTFLRLAGYAGDAILSFSYVPLRLMTLVGCMTSCAGFFLGLFFVVKRLAGMETAGTGFTTLVSLGLLIGGLQLIGLGVLGEYLARVYDEVKHRPLYLVRPRRRNG